jgi:hypothetical protein
MMKFRTFGVAAIVAAAAAVPIAGGGFAGAQDAGDCGFAGPAVAASQTDTGGLLGSLKPELEQEVTTIYAPELSPNAQSCNTNINEVNVGGGGGGGVGVGGGGGGGVGGATPASAVGGAPRFAG